MKKLLIISTLVMLSGCAVNKTPFMSGGSKSDGVVEFSYNYGAMEKPEVNYSKVASDAKNSCSMWGYSNAIPFGSSSRKCTSSSQYGCNAYEVSIKYQCTDELGDLN